MNALITIAFLLAAQAAAPANTNSLTVEQQAGADGAMRHYRVAAGDLNGDGKADKAELQLRCDGGLATDATLTPLATGKRQHKPITITKEWGAATPQLSQAKVGYDVKKVEGSGAKAAGGGIPVTLYGSAPLCALSTISR